jgi:hypothetical protein
MKRIFTVLACVIGLMVSAHAQGVPHRMWIPTQDFHTIHAEGTPNTGVSAAGTAITSEISSFGLIGVPMATADLIATMFPWPDEYHNKLYAVAYRIWWTSDNAADDGAIDWLLDVEEKAMGTEAALTAATVALADGIVFAAETTTIQYGVQATVWDTIGVEAHSTYNYDTMVELSVELNDAGETAADEVHFLGVEIYFIAKDFRGATGYVPGSTSQSTDHGIKLPKRAGY